MSYFTGDKLSLDEAYREVLRPDAGAVILFSGTARNHGSEGTGVVALEYEAKESLANKLLDRIVQEATVKHQILATYVRHRTGRVELEESSIVIAVACAHRAEAYVASREIIDRIKHEAPIWKRAHFANGHTEWSQGCQVCVTFPTLSEDTSHTHSHSPLHSHSHTHVEGKVS